MTENLIDFEENIDYVIKLNNKMVNEFNNLVAKYLRALNEIKDDNEIYKKQYIELMENVILPIFYSDNSEFKNIQEYVNQYRDIMCEDETD